VKSNEKDQTEQHCQQTDCAFVFVPLSSAATDHANIDIADALLIPQNQTTQLGTTNAGETKKG